MRFKSHILKGFIIANMLLSCKDIDFAEQISNYPETKIADNWTMRVPYGLRETGHKDILYEQIFVWPNDSMTLGVRRHCFTIDDGIKQFNNIIENEKQGKVDGPCMGSSMGYSKNYNYIDSVNMLSGVITDYEENGQWGVCFIVISAKTGSGLSLGFKKISLKEVTLVHEILKSIQNH